jgi:hypothetical protein
LKDVGRKKNVDCKNVGPKKVGTFCKMLTKKILEMLKKCWNILNLIIMKWVGGKIKRHYLNEL